MAPKKNGTTPAKKILATKTAQLPVPLTDPEMKRAGEKLAQLEGDLNAHALKEKDVKDSLKSTRSSLEGQIHALAAVIRQTFEYRPVAVRVEADYEAKKVFEIREDSGEVIGERDLNEQDRQASIFDLTPTDARPARPGEPTLEEKAKAVERAALEKDADGILANAGDGAMAAADLKGPAEKRKGARRG